MALSSDIMSGLPPRNPRGFALLLVLAMIILIVPVAAGLAQRSVLARVESRMAREDHIADSVRGQLEQGPLTTWLTKDSSSVVLDLDAKSPRVEVFSEHWELDEVHYSVQLTAWDQCGMASLGSLAAGSPLRSTLPSEVLIRLRSLSTALQKPQTPGLDQLAEGLLEDRLSRPSLFPRDSSDELSALGAWVATHSVGPAGSINVNTAPLPLIEAAMVMTGRGGIELIIAARQKGQGAPLPVAIHGNSEERTPSSSSPRFVGASSSWAVRIDVRVGAIQRSWWTIYQQQSGRWECVQRLVVPE